jgi:hypothetical protein
MTSSRTNWSKDRYATELGLFIDRQVRLDLRKFASSEGIVENRFNAQFAVNRMIFDPTIGKAFPDTRLGNNLFYDTTISPKSFIGPSAEQLLRWNDMRGGYFLMIRPDAFGGSYVLPRSTLPAVRPNIGKGKT